MSKLTDEYKALCIKLIQQEKSRFLDILSKDFKPHSEVDVEGIKIKISSLEVGDGLPNVVKGVATLSDVSLDKFREVYFSQDHKIRKAWDPLCNFCKIPDNFGEGHDYMEIGHSEYQSPSFIVSNRDFSFVRNWWKDETDGSYYLFNASLPEPNDYSPKGKGVVRGTLHLCSTQCKPFEGGKWEVSYLNQIDVKGWLPLWIVNMSIYDQPLVIGRIYNIMKKI